MENDHFCLGKLTISMAIFNSYVKLPEGKTCFFKHDPQVLGGQDLTRTILPSKKLAGSLPWSIHLTTDQTKWPIEIVDLPIDSMVIFHSYGL